MLPPTGSPLKRGFKKKQSIVQSRTPFSFPGQAICLDESLTHARAQFTSLYPNCMCINIARPYFGTILESLWSIYCRVVSGIGTSTSTFPRTSGTHTALLFPIRCTGSTWASGCPSSMACVTGLSCTSPSGWQPRNFERWTLDCGRCLGSQAFDWRVGKVFTWRRRRRSRPTSSEIRCRYNTKHVCVRMVEHMLLSPFCVLLLTCILSDQSA
jgi:hypothetical protein